MVRRMELHERIQDYSHLEDLLDFITTFEGVRYAFVYDTRTDTVFMGRTVSFDSHTREQIRKFIGDIIATSQRIFAEFDCPAGWEEFRIAYLPHGLGRIYQILPLYFILFATDKVRSKKTIFHSIFPIVKDTLLTLANT